MTKLRLFFTGSIPGRPSDRLSAFLGIAIFAGGLAALGQGETALTRPFTDSTSPAVYLASAPAALESSSNPPATVGSAAALPDLPSPRAPEPGTTGGSKVTPRESKYIPAGWQAQPLDTHGKIVVGATDLYSVGNFGAMFLSSGYEQLLNSEPNYGTDKGAFGERLGAAALRETSQGIFTDMVFAPLLHEDPRYYQMGPGHSLVHRTLYAITRPLVTRTDAGRQTINGSLLLGYAASAALTPTYYPSINRNFHDTFSTYAGSIGGAALGSFLNEFAGDMLGALHLKHNQ